MSASLTKYSEKIGEVCLPYQELGKEKGCLLPDQVLWPVLVERKNWRCLLLSPSIRKRLGRSAYLTKNSEKNRDVYFLIKYSGLYCRREKIGDVCLPHQVL